MAFEDFWPYYVGEHRRPVTRLLHFIGTLCGFVLLARGHWILAPVVSYAFAWTGHLFVERNAPATFKHPLLSLRGDVVMFGLMLAGRMEAEVERLSPRA